MVAVMVIIGGYFIGHLLGREVVLKILCAGSLTLPLEEIAEEFEELHSGIRVAIEPSGSVICIRKVVELGKEVDVVAVSDHGLIPKMMMLDHADWYLIFAKNQMVLAFTNISRYAVEINSTNWYELLRKPEVKWGFSNPNLDPCGYRTLMVIQLAELHCKDFTLFDDLILENTAITVSEKDGNYTIRVPEDLAPNTPRIMVRDKEVDLISMLEEGGLDYAFEYRSIAVQHHLSYINLSSAIDLSDLERAETYRIVQVVLSSGDVMVGAPITYGVTIPRNAPNRQLAEEFVKLIINDFGRGIFSKIGQPHLSPAIANDLEALPLTLRQYCIGGSS